MAVMVSVVTALFNSERFVGSTIESVLAQSYEDWELIVVDDGSSDGSCDIVGAHASADPRVRLVRLDSNRGPAAARNVGISVANGRFLAFLDSDDIWHPQKLERQIDFMSTTGSVLSCTSYEHIDEHGERTGRVIEAPDAITYEDLLRKCRIGCLTAIYDTAALGKVYMPEIRRRQDYGLWLRILKRSNLARGLPEVLAYYRVRPQSLSSNKYILPWYHWQLYRQEGIGPLKAAFLALSYSWTSVLDSRRPVLRSSASSADEKHRPALAGCPDANVDGTPN